MAVVSNLIIGATGVLGVLTYWWSVKILNVIAGIITDDNSEGVKGVNDLETGCSITIIWLHGD